VKLDYLSYYCDYEIKGTGTDRRIKGYASVFGNVDAAGDIVAPGAFKATIAKAKSGESQWPVMLLQHSAEENPIGVWDAIDEDDHGLLVQGKLANTKKGRDTYELLKMKPRPALSGLSIGYRVRESENHKSGPARRTIKAADLCEISIVTFPANARATITAVKAYVEPEPVVVDWKEVARADFERLSREMTKGNRSGW
jgi:uncharacterized protein